MLEADFARFFRLDPLDLSWRRFIVMLRGLPYDSLFWSHIRSEQEQAPENVDVFAELDKHRGLPPAAQVSRFGASDIDRIHTQRR